MESLLFVVSDRHEISEQKGCIDKNGNDDCCVGVDVLRTVRRGAAAADGAARGIDAIVHKSWLFGHSRFMSAIRCDDAVSIGRDLHESRSDKLV